jgi:hypothetical protein
MRWLLEDSTEPPIIPTTESRVYEDAGTYMNYYLEDEIYSRGSTDLEQVYANAAPSPSPPPVGTRSLSRTRLMEGDWVLVREMAPIPPKLCRRLANKN